MVYCSIILALAVILQRKNAEFTNNICEEMQPPLVPTYLQAGSPVEVLIDNVL